MRGLWAQVHERLGLKVQRECIAVRPLEQRAALIKPGHQRR